MCFREAASCEAMASMQKYFAPGMRGPTLCVSLPSFFLLGRYQVASRTLTLPRFSASHPGLTTGSTVAPVDRAALACMAKLGALPLGWNRAALAETSTPQVGRRKPCQGRPKSERETCSLAAPLTNLRAPVFTLRHPPVLIESVLYMDLIVDYTDTKQK